MARATLRSAELVSRGTFRAAKLSLAAAVVAALIAGLCSVVGVAIQGRFALEQARMTATATAAPEKVSTPSVIEPRRRTQTPEAEQLNPAAVVAPLVDVAKLSASCFCVSVLLPGMAMSTALWTASMIWR